jgi:hypothetical protein
MTTDTASVPDVNPRPFSFDDIEKYTRCSYRGVNGYIIDKGEHLSSTEGKHIQIELDRPIHSSHTTPVLKSNLVNKYLDKKRVLWIDWNDRLTPHANSRYD